MKFKQVYIEIGNQCNLSCNFCPGTKRETAQMDIALFRHIISQIKEFSDQIYLHVMGEPLLHPDLGTMLDLAHTHDIRVNITTNGSLLDDEKRRILQHPAVRQVNFSLHAFKTLPFALQRELQLFIQECFDFRADLYINLRLWNYQGDENIAEQNLALLHELLLPWQIHLEDQDFSVHRKSRRLLNRLYLHRDTLFQWPDIDSNLPPLTEGYCHGLIDQFAILCNGQVTACCLDHDGDINLGNVKDRSLREILKSETSEAIRNGFKQRKRVEKLCMHCSFASRFD